MRRWIHSLVNILRVKSIQFIITVSFSLIVIVMLFVGLIIYNKFSDASQQNAILNTKQIVEQVQFSIEDYLKGMTDIFSLVDKKIGSSNSISDNKLYEQLDTVLNTREDIVSLALFTNTGEMMLTVPALPIRKNTKLMEQSWFKSAEGNPNHLSFSNPHIQNLFQGQYKWVVSLSKGITFYRDNVKMTGVLLVDVNFKTINDLSQRVKLGEKGYIYIVDESSGNMVYHPQQQLIYLGLKNEQVDNALGFTFGHYMDNSNYGRRLNTVETINNIGWKIIGVSYLNEIITTKKEIRTFIFWLLITVIIFILLISTFMSFRISQPIKKLKQSMELVEKGDFTISLEIRGGGEIELFSRRFNLMISRIRQLMDQIILEQETKRKYELEVLQAQINPHFLYNTLNSAVRMVGNGKSEDVITTITSLSKLFRISLSSGKNIITIAEEIEHIRHYLIIQKMRFKEKFQYEFEVQEEALQCLTLKLILQPIVENSIYHGIEYMVDQGHIKISVGIVEERVLLQVEDNGLGMPPHKVASIFLEHETNTKGSGVGVNNVQERIRLYYGKDFGLQFESQLEVGTIVKIWIPLIKADPL